MTPKASSQLTIAITGATGFVGKHLTQHLCAAGHSVRALTRRTKSESDDSNLAWIQGDLEDASALAELVSSADVVIHGAGAIKALSRADFFHVNRDGTQSVLDAALKADVSRFVLVSSLAAREPMLSDYAASKRAAELVLEDHSDHIATVVLRPPAIYGPGDRETARLFQMANNGFVLAPGRREARVSLIHVGDVVTALKACCEQEQPREPLEIDDGTEGGYTWEDITAAAGQAVDRAPRRFQLPAAAVWVAGLFGSTISLITRKPIMLTLAKVKELLHDDWHARGPVPQGWSPAWPLEKGFEDAVHWYSSQNILKRYF